MKRLLLNKFIFLFSITGIIFSPSVISTSNAQTNPDNGNKKSEKITEENGKKYYLHTVGKSQSLMDISKIYDVTVNKIIVENPDAIDGIEPGGVLKIPFTEQKTIETTGSQTKETVIPQPADPVASPIPPIEKALPASLKISGYVDAYYAYYTDSVGTNNYQKFPVISPKSNQFGLNIVQITAQYSAEKTRAIATLHYGDIPSSAWSPVFNMIQEANAGVRLTKKIWLDGGFFKTHIGTEALLPKDNIASSLSIITFYEPWWQAGFRLTYTPNDKLLIALHALNGYNTFIDNNKSKSFGLSLAYTFGEKGSIGYYNIIGEESPDNSPSKHLRFLNNLVFTYQLTSKLKTIIGVDYITQQHSDISDTTKTAAAFSAIVTFKYQLKPKFGIYLRGETFSDNSGFLSTKIIDATNNVTGYILNDATLGFEYKPMDNAYIRLEGRDIIMDERQKIFRTDGTNTNSRIEVIFNIGVWF